MSLLELAVSTSSVALHDEQLEGKESKENGCRLEGLAQSRSDQRFHRC